MPTPSAASELAGPSTVRAHRELSRSQQLADLFTAINPRLERWVGLTLTGTAGRWAEDAVSGAWMKLAASRTVDLSEPNKVSGWLKRAAYTTALDLQRHHERTIPADSLDATVLGRDGSAMEVEVDGGSDVPAAVEVNADLHDALERLAELPPAQQKGLLMQALGYSYDEIADITGWSARRIDRAITDGRAAVRNAPRHERLFSAGVDARAVAARAARAEVEEAGRAQSPAEDYVQDALFPGL